MVASVETPQWLSEPLEMALECSYVGEERAIRERVVQFDLGGEQYISFVPGDSVHPEKKLMLVNAIATLSDGSYLVELPAETLTTGMRIKVRQDAPELIHDPRRR